MIRTAFFLILLFGTLCAPLRAAESPPSAGACVIRHQQQLLLVQDRISSRYSLSGGYIDAGVSEGAQLLVDGREFAGQQAGAGCEQGGDRDRRAEPGEAPGGRARHARQESTRRGERATAPAPTPHARAAQCFAAPAANGKASGDDELTSFRL